MAKRKNKNKYLKTTNRQNIKEIPPETVGAEPVSGGISFIFCRLNINQSTTAIAPISTRASLGSLATSTAALAGHFSVKNSA